MPKYLARWTRTQATDLEFEADDDELAYDHATHIEMNSVYLQNADWSDGEIELRDVEEVSDDHDWAELDRLRATMVKWDGDDWFRKPENSRIAMLLDHYEHPIE